MLCNAHIPAAESFSPICNSLLENFPISLWKNSLMMGKIRSKNSEGKAQLSLQELVRAHSFQARNTWTAGVTHTLSWS